MAPPQAGAMDARGSGPAFESPSEPPRRPRLELAPAVQQDRSRTGMFALLGLVALVSLGAFWFFFLRSDDPASEFESADGQTTDSVEDTVPADPAGAETTEDTTAAPADPAAPLALEGAPTLALDGADGGPLETEVAYTINLSPVPVDSQYIVIVDGQEQPGPIDFVPDLVLPEGRHSIVIRVLHNGQTADSNAVDVYVLPGAPQAGWRANLSSVDIVNEGWGEAVRQFDDYRGAGHEQLVLTPSDPYPELLPGYWNIYVGGFADRASAASYCEEFGLEVPVDCFPSEFTAAGAAPAEDPAAEDSAEGADADSTDAESTDG